MGSNPHWPDAAPLGAVRLHPPVPAYDPAMAPPAAPSSLVATLPPRLWQRDHATARGFDPLPGHSPPACPVHRGVGDGREGLSHQEPDRFEDEGPGSQA